MILTVTLNPCLHKFVKFRGDLDGRLVLRPVETEYQGGGKGINAARAIRRLGGDVMALTFTGGPVGSHFEHVVRGEGIPLTAVATRDATRMSTVVFGVDTLQFREFLEGGARVEADEAAAMERQFAAMVSRVSIVTLNGSVSDPCLDDFYAKAIEQARAAGKRVLVDTYGRAAPLAAAARPFLLKANLDEVRASFGADVSDAAAVARFARGLLDTGIEHVVLTDGAKAAWLHSRDGSYRVTPSPVRELNPVGSGDAMLGVLALEIDRGSRLPDALRLAAAAGAANAERLGICDFSRERIAELSRSVEVTEA